MIQIRAKILTAVTLGFSLAFVFATVSVNAGAFFTSLELAGDNIVVSWEGRGALETADRISGPWNSISQNSPHTNELTGTSRFYRINQTVDATTLEKKVLCGYQGWFRCPGDGSNEGWVHWSRTSTRVAPETLTFEMWPDMSEYTVVEKHPTPGFTYPDGTQAHLFSSYNRQTVARHFDWMLEHGLDGAFLQRFVAGVSNPSSYNVILNHVREAANGTGRTFALTYDMTGTDTSILYNAMVNDWKRLVDQGVTRDPRYLHHDGKPVLMIWGFFKDRFTSALAHRIIDFFKTNSTYEVTLIGGAQWWWRSEIDAGWSNAFRRFDYVSPWNVGNVSVSGNTKHASTAYWSQDLSESRRVGMGYMPVIYPGFSWDNLQRQPPGSSTIPRLGGDFFWKQFYDAARLGVQTAYIAMFDEVDEATAIFKVSNTPPIQGHFITYEGRPSDWYLRLAAEGTKLLAGERSNTRAIPISP